MARAIGIVLFCFILSGCLTNRTTYIVYNINIISNSPRAKAHNWIDVTADVKKDQKADAALAFEVPLTTIP